MLPRPQPKVFILLVKTHKFTALLTASNTSSVEDVKAMALEALQSKVMDAPNPHADAMDEDDNDWVVPKVSSTDDFELAKAVKEKGRPTGRYETLEGQAKLKNVVANWESVFVQFKLEGELLPVKVSLPPIFVEEEEERKGKRKAE